MNAQISYSAPTSRIIEKTSHHASAYDEHTLHFLLELHGSLSIRDILALFTETLSQDIPYDYIAYTNGELPLVYEEGIEATHKLFYQLALDGKHIGELTFARRKRFTQSEVHMIEVKLSLLLKPLYNAVCHEEALRAALQDPLTGLSNRQALSSSIRREVELAKRYNQSLSVLMLDIDHFKTINDTYGHAVGDSLLKTFAATLTESTRESDLVFRTGGEEFLIILCKTDIEGAIRLADRLRKAINSINFSQHNQTIPLTASVGVASYVSGDSTMTLSERADQALYRAKQQGRDRVCV